MNPIRYAKRTCTDQEHINAFLAAARVGHLGLTDGLEPYVVPLNFCWLNGSVERVEDPEEMRDALQAMLDKYVPGYYDRPLSEGKRFSPGRTHKMDV
ncbi:hypothetical protein O3V59_16880 [Brevibacillus thermoruber]|jgi:uncharacterized protein|uniref:Uncharacterized protein n=1 Tax=Brevibacillus thermoruber TaxID=33942 RepID=A0A9X3Z4P9_9BACL|nr:hypothetical protein [Brevibacillus thermoruber]MDA5110043.1 hypothetical protein [Brevibacillus thermoruber]